MAIKILEAYTDGACSQNRDGNWHGGYGVFFNWEGMQKSYSGGEIHTTNNKMEMQAIIKALEVIFNNLSWVKQEYDVIHILSDSSYIVDGMNFQWYEKWKQNGWKTSKKKDVKNKELWQKIVSLHSVINDSVVVKYNHVKSHVGIEGNEMADKLAVEARNQMKVLDEQNNKNKSNWEEEIWK